MVHFLAAAFFVLAFALAFFTPPAFLPFLAAAFLGDFDAAAAAAGASPAGAGALGVAEASPAPAAFFPRPLAAAIMSFNLFVCLQVSVWKTCKESTT